MTDTITLAHGSGGEDYRALVEEIFAPAFHNKYLAPLTDAAVCPGGGRIALTTDGYVVRPLFFPGGDIGRLAVSGTVNDLAVSGAVPRYLSASFVLEAGLPLDTLKRIVRSMAETAAEANVSIVTGDTKVVEAGGVDSIFISTAGVGVFPDGAAVPPQVVAEGDAIVTSGPLASHGMAVMAARNGFAFDPPIESDVRPMARAVRAVLDAGCRVRAMRDPTRGGAAGTLAEWAGKSFTVTLQEDAIPVRADAADACAILGIDPLYVANEGVVLFSLPPEDAARAIAALKSVSGCEQAAVIGRVSAGEGRVCAETRIGTYRRVLPPAGELLPRIC